MVCAVLLITDAVYRVEERSLHQRPKRFSIEGDMTEPSHQHSRQCHTSGRCSTLCYYYGVARATAYHVAGIIVDGRNHDRNASLKHNTQGAHTPCHRMDLLVDSAVLAGDLREESGAVELCKQDAV